MINNVNEEFELNETDNAIERINNKIANFNKSLENKFNNIEK